MKVLFNNIIYILSAHTLQRMAERGISPVMIQDRLALGDYSVNSRGCKVYKTDRGLCLVVGDNNVIVTVYIDIPRAGDIRQGEAS